jgi:ABC-2 type transport system ATP-binding protein
VVGLNNELLKVDNLWAGYRKGTPSIRNLSFSLESGEIVGLIGPNGAGKSTTIKVILGLIEKWQGQVILPSIQDKGYSYIPELPALYDELTLWEHLEIVAMAHGLKKSTFEQKARKLLKQYNMMDYQYSLPGGFSKGMRQKVMVLCACLVQPALYLVDEPFNGLDPFAINELLNWFSAEKARGSGILLSTHVLDIAERICDRFILINHGQIAAGGTMQQLQEHANLPDARLFDVFAKLIRR